MTEIDERAKRYIKRFAYWLFFVILLIGDVFMILDMLGK